jgi:ubiquinone/menaquinone biosynthesis C-methylase UbiE/DNA-binding MarR family transcriptional regulator
MAMGAPATSSTPHLARELRQGIRALVRRFSVAERADVSCCGMTVAQAATLEALEDGPLRLNELSTRLGIAASTLSRNLARLEERGFVRTAADPADRRSRRVALTDDGRRAATDVEHQEEAFARSVLDRLPPGSAEVALEGFRRLVTAVQLATEECCPGAFEHLAIQRPDAGGEVDLGDRDTDRNRTTEGDEAMVATVRQRYAGFATAGTSCCGPASSSCCGTTGAVASILGYDTVDLELLPDGANLGLGCGAPLAHLELASGETVLDLGAGAGVDALIAARAVGPEGRVIGVDMTPEMLAAARANAAGTPQVEFREGRLERLPVDDASVDAVTSNCVINLVPDKRAVFAEIARVLRPGGRLAISDIVLDGELPAAVRDSVMAYVGCVAGAERRETYFRMLADAGLVELEVLKDIDFLETIEKASSAEVLSLTESAGIPREEVAEIVRSVTYRARKR